MTDNIEKTIFSTRWLSIKETPKGFQYLERKGRDSVAVFLLRGAQGQPLEQTAFASIEVLIRWQPLCIDKALGDKDLTLYPCPITGSIDGGEKPHVAAQREVLEEAGYDLALEAINPLGYYVVGTQTNEICSMYWADVTGLVPQSSLGDGSFFESISRNEWGPIESLKSCIYGACQLGYFKLKEALG